MLEHLGYVVLQAAGGDEAVRLAEAHKDPIDVLMTDVVMPGMNGRQLAARLLEIHPETRVLFTPGYTEDAIARHGVIEAGLDFIGKPYTLRELIGP